MDSIKKAIICAICVAVFVVLWKMNIFSNRLILAGVGIIFAFIAYKIWDN